MHTLSAELNRKLKEKVPGLTVEADRALCSASVAKLAYAADLDSAGGLFRLGSSILPARILPNGQSERPQGSQAISPSTQNVRGDLVSRFPTYGSFNNDEAKKSQRRPVHLQTVRYNTLRTANLGVLVRHEGVPYSG